VNLLIIEETDSISFTRTALVESKVWVNSVVEVIKLPGAFNQSDVINVQNVSKVCDAMS
jgi:hypothetical protein